MARRLMTLIAAAATMFSIGSPPQDGGGAPCPDIVMSLVDCLTYVEVSGGAKRPSVACCSSMADVLEDVPQQCICKMLEMAKETGIMVNMTRALHIPAACSLRSANIRCQAAPSHAPSPSPNRSPSPSSNANRPATPSPSTPSTPLSPSQPPSTPSTPSSSPSPSPSTPSTPSSSSSSSPSPSPSTLSSVPAPSPSTRPVPWTMPPSIPLPSPSSRPVPWTMPPSIPLPSPSSRPVPWTMPPSIPLPSPSSRPVPWTMPPSIPLPSPSTPPAGPPQSSAALITPGPAPAQDLNEAPSSPYAPKVVALLVAAGCAFFLAH